MAAPKKALDRIAANLNRCQAILSAAKTRDVSESDTCVIVADMLAGALVDGARDAGLLLKRT